MLRHIELQDPWAGRPCHVRKMDNTPLLLARGIVKEFPGVRAVDGVDFTVRRGRFTRLMGENGAGKSTLLKVITGAALSRDGGEIVLDGQPIHPRSPALRSRWGSARCTRR